MKLLDAAFEFLYPPKCIICEKAITDYGYCADCDGKLKPISAPLCPQCGLDEDNCECKKRIYHFDAIAAPYFNEGYAQQGVYDLKFSQKFYCMRPFGDDMARVVKKNFGIENIDLICCVPPKPESMYKRGFNQSDLFASIIADKLKIRYDKNLIKLLSSRNTQHRLKTIEDRFANVRNNYAVYKKINGLNVLLVDDIKTTGATIDECARQLKFAGANKVYCVTALITRRNRSESSHL